MVATLKPNDLGSLPGGALPAVPFATGLEVDQRGAAISPGHGFLLGGALVATPFFPGG